MKADEIVLQLAESRPTAFTRDGWGFELKLDGFRLLAERVDGKVRLLLRRGRDATRQFPEIAEALSRVPGGDFIFDGELVIQDETGRPVFQRLLTRGTLTGAREIERGRQADPAVYFAFDLLRDGGEDLRPLPLRARKARLLERLPKLDRVLPVEFVEREGEALLEAVRQQKLEGIVAKDLSAPYRGGRSASWYKIALHQSGDFAVVGYAKDWNSLYLATWDGTQFEFAGRVGAGVSPTVIRQLRARLERGTIDQRPFVGEPPDPQDARWCTPEVVVEVRYKNWPEGLSIREPIFLRVREDKAPTECHTPRSGFAPPPVRVTPPPKISNADKILFPDDGITKGELVEYYRKVARWLLPYLRDRPLMLTRYPDGIRGKSFFQKAAPPKAPDFVRTIKLRSDEDTREIDQIVCDDARTLEWCANLATMPLHLPAGRVGSLDRADWSVIDFDPKSAPFEDVVTLANALHEQCEAIGLPTFVKTSGANGLHVMIPLAGQLDHAGAQQLAELLSQHVVAAFPKLATLERVIQRRAGRVYLDTLQNGAGKLIASPFCVRPYPTAPVSMPIEWSEVRPGLSPRDWNVKNAIVRLEEKGDPMAKLLSTRVDLGAVLSKLG